ncbi:acetyl-CoA acetyltransferase [Streptomyces tsukubensis]|uniref:Thiolase n=1 Tax=Streptomyces tsukubensis TaxID=83656 RepID=A0A1V4A2H9_9ACTN|nr:acetyl-CoA acetyltransferase [Streptomyces tsukubensis]OON72754.1 thiolase [Streptomyces tsukubensis]QFR96854.1 thiolase [Streptomyces tsukubensis]
MSRRRRAAIVGVAESEVGRTPHLTVLSQQAAATRAALSEAGLGPGDVDALFVAGNWSWAPALTLAEYLGLSPDYLDSTNIGGSSFEAHLGHATAAIEAGLIDVALITYGSTQRSNRSRASARPPATLTEQFDRPFGLPQPVGAYALAANRYFHQYGATGEQLAEVAVSARQWAAHNPHAYHRDPITVDDVLGSPMISDPLHVLDCCLVTDGGGALVVAAEDRWPDVRTRPVVVLGHGETTTHHSIARMPDLTVTGAARSGPAAMKMAGVTHADFDLLEIYDSFTITVLLTLESLGFCEPGGAGELVALGRTGPGGDLPMNTNGGGLSYTHPGMYGIFLLIEATRQLRHDFAAGSVRQVDDARLALVHGTGGVLSSTSTVVLGRG